MEKTITVYCKNTRTYHEVPRGISLIELKDRLGIQLKYPIIAAMLPGEIIPDAAMRAPDIRSRTVHRVSSAPDIESAAVSYGMDLFRTES